MIKNRTLQSPTTTPKNLYKPNTRETSVPEHGCGMVYTNQSNMQRCQTLLFFNYLNCGLISMNQHDMQKTVYHHL